MLDKDATDKLPVWYVRCTLMFDKTHGSSNDLKNMQKDERDDFLRSYIDR